MPDPATVLNLKDVLASRLIPAVTRWNRLEGRPRTHHFDRALAAEVRDAVAQTGGLGVMIGPGCVLPLATPDAHLAAVVAAVKAAA